MHDPAYIKELFSRLLAGDCSQEEINILINYLENEDNESVLPSVEEFQALFRESHELGSGPSERIFRNLDNIIKKDTAPRKLPVENFRKKLRSASFRKRYPWLQAAAALTLLFALSFIFYLGYRSFAPEKYHTAFAKITTVKLDDGTLVTLNANSDLKVDLSEKDIREVWLQGEAFFRVAHDTERKFIVHTSGQFAVEVLGTEFNVKDRPEGTSVVLSKGSVKVKLLEDNSPAKELLIKPGEMVAYQSASRALTKSYVDTVKYSSWKHNLLVFEESSLVFVGHTIQNQFGYKVRFASDSIAALRFTGSSPADDLEMLLNTLEKSFDLSLTSNGREIMIGVPERN